jgi:hypothetical protein
MHSTEHHLLLVPSIGVSTPLSFGANTIDRVSSAYSRGNLNGADVEVRESSTTGDRVIECIVTATNGAPFCLLQNAISEVEYYDRGLHSLAKIQHRLYEHWMQESMPTNRGNRPSL